MFYACKIFELQISFYFISYFQINKRNQFYKTIGIGHTVTLRHEKLSLYNQLLIAK